MTNNCNFMKLNVFHSIFIKPINYDEDKSATMFFQAKIYTLTQ